MSYNLPAITKDQSLSQYIQKVNNFPYLTDEEEQNLANKWYENQDMQAAHKLVTSHLRLVVKIANGFKNYGLPMLDVISEGNIGLMQAVKKFDPTKGFRLSTYAMWWIKASIQEYVLHSWSLVKIGTTAAQKKLFFGLRKVKQKLQKIDQTQLSKDQVALIADEMNVSEKEVIDMDMRMTMSDSSLDKSVNNQEDGASESFIDFLADDSQNQESLLLESDDYNHKLGIFKDAFANLNEREQYIIVKRKLEEPAATLEDLSQKFDISRERVRQIEARALEKLSLAAKS